MTRLMPMEDPQDNQLQLWFERIYPASHVCKQYLDSRGRGAK